jgi:hypothetical protein
MSLEIATRAVVTVGVGRGFVVRGRDDGDGGLIITAAHCLPSLPPCASFSRGEEQCYPDLLAPLGAEPSVRAACLFVDPIADIAVLGRFDDTYFELVGEVEPLEISRSQGQRAFLLSLQNRWFGCRVEHDEYDGSLYLRGAELPFIDGMSGSPILDENGRPIGVTCVSRNTKNCTEGGGHPRLMNRLPSWCLN